MGVSRKTWLDGNCQGRFKFFGLELNIDKLKKYIKATFSKLVRKKMRNSAYEYLFDKKDQHTKMDGIRYNKGLKKQDYLNRHTFYKQVS